MTAPTNADWVNAMNEVARLKTENDALRADAERYRWLRVQPYADIAACWYLPAHCLPENWDSSLFDTPEKRDAAIDAARSTDPSTGERTP
jgi:hypothetical protein